MTFLLYPSTLVTKKLKVADRIIRLKRIKLIEERTHLACEINQDNLYYYGIYSNYVYDGYGRWYAYELQKHKLKLHSYRDIYTFSYQESDIHRYSLIPLSNRQPWFLFYVSDTLYLELIHILSEAKVVALAGDMNNIRFDFLLLLNGPIIELMKRFKEMYKDELISYNDKESILKEMLKESDDNENNEDYMVDEEEEEEEE